MSNKLRIYVYAIAKNESKFVERWVDSMSEADGIYVLDTGSTDETVNLLTQNGVTVKSKSIIPWRFDVARNESMKITPIDANILVCTDIDEVFLKGWRSKLEAAWINAMQNGVAPTNASYEYVWNFNADGSDGNKFSCSKIHAPGVCIWTHPVHEILAYPSRKHEIFVNGIRLEHHPDKTKSRSSYLDLLQLAVSENPGDSRDMYYLAREYMFNKMYKPSIETFRKYLDMEGSTWDAERASAMTYMSDCYKSLRMHDNQELWLRRAITECPRMREPFLRLAGLLYANQKWRQLANVCDMCLRLTKQDYSFIVDQSAWDYRIYDFACISNYNLGNNEIAAEMAKEAYIRNPNDSRVKDNARFFHVV